MGVAGWPWVWASNGTSRRSEAIVATASTSAVALGSHDPEADFGDATLRGLIPTRILMRHRDKTLAKRGLKWLDLDPDAVLDGHGPIADLPVDRTGVTLFGQLP